MSLHNQAILLLDIDKPVARDSLLACIPGPHNERTFHVLSEQGIPPVDRLQADEVPIDWIDLGDAVHRLIESLPKSTEDRAVEYHIAGHGPLPVFTMLGIEMWSWGDAQAIHNQDRNTGAWHSFKVESPDGAQKAAEGTPFFDTRPSLASSVVAHGWLGLAVSVRGGPAVPREPLIKALDRELAGIEELSVRDHRVLTAENMPLAVHEIRTALSGLRGAYPNAQGVALFIDGPASLAFLVGRAINPKVWPQVRVYYHHRSGREELAFELPWRSPSQQRIGTKPEDIQRRQKALSVLVAGFEALKKTLRAEDLPETHPDPGAFVERMKPLEISRDPQGEIFRLTVMEDRIELSAGLLEAVTRLSEEDQKRFSHLLLLHELLHFEQGLYHSNYADIGRAGVALEEVDYVADAFSIETILRWHCRRDPGAEETIKELACQYIRTALRGMQAFDEMEQGPTMTRLAERRLRRYLIWHFQLQRAGTIRKLQDAKDLLRGRVILELAPLAGTLDRRYDKFVSGTILEEGVATELVAICNGILARYGRNSSLNLEALIEEVRRFDHGAIQKAMRHIVETKRKEFVPWRT
ncbi:MAG: SAVED domain-containing protein [Polyangia bacterium]